MKKATRLTPLGDRAEAPSRKPAPITANTHWRTAKWNGSPTFMRAAAAGLEAKDSSTPRVIRMPTTPSRMWSVVHHHRPRRERAVGAGEGVRLTGGGHPVAPLLARLWVFGAEGEARSWTSLRKASPRTSK